MPTEFDKDKENAPVHVAIIMDGNGRWAKERGKPRIYGHSEGAKRIREVLSAAKKAGVKFLTLYAFSSENWNRPPDEVAALMNPLVSSIEEYGRELVENRVRFVAIGEVSALPPECSGAVRRLEENTREFSGGTLALALNSGSRAEAAKAARLLAQKAARGEIDPSSIDWEAFSSNLDTAGMPDPDLIIRTSGEQRLSNFLTLQAAYSELYFTDVYWPDFGEEEFFKAVGEFKRRERRYGKTADQL